MNFPKCEYCGKLAIKGICARCKAKRRLNPNLKKLSMEEMKNSTISIRDTVQSKTNLTYYERNKEHILKRQKKYYQENKEKILK